MRLSVKTGFFLAAATAGLVAGTYLVVEATVLHGFAEEERLDAVADLERVVQVVRMLDADFANRQCPDYAYWTDLAQFAGGAGAAGFAEENLTFDGFKSLGWAFVAVYGASPPGPPAQRFSMTIHPAANAGAPLAPAVRRFIEGSLLTGIERHAEPLHGLAQIEGELYLVASLPTKTSEHRPAAVPGRFVAALPVDAAWVDRVARFTALPIQLLPVSAAGNDPLFARAHAALQRGDRVFVEAPTARALVGVAPLPDYTDRPLLYARIERPRTATTRGAAVLRTTLATLAAGGALLLLVALGMLDATVLGPVRRLLGSVRRLAAGELSRVEVDGRDELGELAREFNQMAATLVDREAKLDQVLHELWGEMDLAKRIQTALLPPDPAIPGFRVAAHMETAEQVGGDYYDVIPSSAGPWLAIGDVSGHGVTAGLVMMIAQTAIRTAILHETEGLAAPGGAPSPSRVLATTNRILMEDMRRLGTDKYMTVSLLRRVDDRLFAHAGLHLDIVVYRRARQQVELVATRGMWLGVTASIEKHLRDQIFEVHPGDVVVLYTDGLIEAERDEREFGLERLCEVVTRAAERGDATEIRAALLEALAPWRRQDDVSFLVLERLPLSPAAKN